jgi:tRNA pseudouridine55 synthase
MPGRGWARVDSSRRLALAAARFGHNRRVIELAPGLRLLHKPVGPTSAALVRELAGAAAEAGAPRRPMCHGGTLDPFARGLLIVAIGQATRIIDLVHDVPKEYEAVVAWGTETDNGDPLGCVVATGDATTLTAERLDAALAEQVGWREQVPPATSAKRIGGERAYVRAHRGEVFELPPVRVLLHEARWLGHDLAAGRSRLFLRCGRGYYVRALVRDLGRATGCRAHVAELHRTAVGPWRDPGAGRALPVTGEALFPWLAARSLDEREARQVAQGQPIAAGTLGPPTWTVPPGFPAPQDPVRGVAAGRLVALLRRLDATRLAPFANLRGGL